MKRPSSSKISSPRLSRSERLRRAQAPLGLGAALGAFALLCGLILLLGGTRLACNASDSPSPSTTTAQIQSALDTTQSARSALQGQNYGEARRALQELQDTLAAILSRLAPPSAHHPSAPGPTPEAPESAPTP